MQCGLSFPASLPWPGVDLRSLEPVSVFIGVMRVADLKDDSQQSRVTKASKFRVHISGAPLIGKLPRDMFYLCFCVSVSLIPLHANSPSCFLFLGM